MLAGVYVLLWLGGVISYVVFDRPPEDAGWTAPVFLFLSALLVVVNVEKDEAVRLAAAGALGFLVEIVGARVGIPFGEYSYTEALTPQLFGVPLAMAAAWIVLIGYVRNMLGSSGLPGWLRPVLAALWMTAIDLLIDPLAAGRMDYWRWKGSGSYYGIPDANFFGWFVVSMGIFMLLRRDVRRNAWCRGIGLSTVIFFSCIAVASDLLIAATVGLGLGALHLVVALRAPREEGLSIRERQEKPQLDVGNLSPR
jgi:uncharacterized membrane protein